MKKLSLYTVDSGKRKQIPFIAEEALQVNFNSAIPRRDAYFAVGNFGKVEYRLFHFCEAIFQLVKLNLTTDIQLEIHTDPENLSFIYGENGFFLFQSGTSPLELVLQTQIKLFFNEVEGSHFLYFGDTRKKEYSFLHISFPISSASGNDVSIVGVIKKYLKRVTTFPAQIPAFTSIIDNQKVACKIKNEIENSEPDERGIQAYLNVLLLESIEIAGSGETGESGLEVWDPEIKAVYAMAENIILGMDEPWTIKKLAGTQSVNPNKLKMLFKKHMGVPAAAFRISVRMQKASQLLKETSLSIQEISALVGYSNPAQFSTMFKRKMGCPPNQLRKA